MQDQLIGMLISVKWMTLGAVIRRELTMLLTGDVELPRMENLRKQGDIRKMILETSSSEEIVRSTKLGKIYERPLARRTWM